MEELEIIPLKGIGKVELAMSRSKVREEMGKPYSTFAKIHGTDTPPVDAYFKNQFQIFYDKNDKVEFIELSGYRSEHITARLKGIVIFETPANTLIEKITKDLNFDFDPEDPELGYSYVFPKIELAVWRPTLPVDEVDKSLEEYGNGKYFMTIGIGIHGYFSNK